MFAMTVDHLEDGRRQAIYKRMAESSRFAAKQQKIARRMLRDPAARERLGEWMSEKGFQRPEDIPVPEAGSVRRGPQLLVAKPDPEGMRFPSLGYGLSTINTALVGGPWVDGKPPEGKFELLRGTQQDADKMAGWITSVGDWHSSYPTGSMKKPREFYPLTEPGNGRVGQDGRFWYRVDTLPAWDTQALADGMAAGEVPASDFEDILRKYDAWAATEGVRLASCGAERPLVHSGTDFHLQDGSLHAHPRGPKSAPSWYERADGSKQPRSEAPTRGRARKGEGWRGGERLGLIDTDGRLVLNTLGPSLVAADAWREAGLPPPADYGDDWGFQDRIIASRRDGGHYEWADESKTQKTWVPDAGVTAGKDGKGIGLDPVDLAGSRYFRGLVREYAQRNPKFSKRRDEYIEKARLAAIEGREALTMAVAGDDIAKAKSAKTEAESRLAVERQGREQAEAAKTVAERKLVGETGMLRMRQAAERKVIAIADALETLAAGGRPPKSVQDCFSAFKSADGKWKLLSSEVALLGPSPSPAQRARVEGVLKAYASYMAVPAVQLVPAEKLVEAQAKAEKLETEVVAERQGKAAAEAKVALMVSPEKLVEAEAGKTAAEAKLAKVESELAVERAKPPIEKVVPDSVLARGLLSALETAISYVCNALMFKTTGTPPAFVTKDPSAVGGYAFAGDFAEKLTAIEMLWPKNERVAEARKNFEEFSAQTVAPDYGEIEPGRRRPPSGAVGHSHGGGGA